MPGGSGTLNQPSALVAVSSMGLPRAIAPSKMYTRAPGDGVGVPSVSITTPRAPVSLQGSTSGGLALTHAGSVQTLKPYEPRGILNALSLGRLETFFAKQWLIVAEKPA